MRITRLKLVNYIGIKHGLGENELEIVFPDNGNAFTMLVGGNGSGKSTIQSQLHPFKESFDDRKELILPGLIGRKEIDIEHNGSEYKIVHIFDKTSASFIMKDGEELNPNGKVRTFEDVVANELEVTKDYFKIGKIGTNTDNFVQFSTSQRKEYISNFVQEVEKYLEKFKIVSDKFKLDTEKIKMVAKELNKYEDISSIKVALTDAKELLEQYEEQILTLTKEVAVNETLKDSLVEQTKDIDYVKLKQQYDSACNSIKYLEATIANIEHLQMNNPNFKDDLLNVSQYESEIESLQINHGVLSKELETLKNQLVTLTNRKTNAEFKMSGLTTYKADDTLKSQCELLEKHVEQLNNEYNNLKIKPFVENSVNELSMYLLKYETFMQFILNNFNNLIVNTLLEKYRNIDLFFSKDCPNIIKNEIIQLKTNIANKEKMKENLNKEYGVKSANIGKLDILEKRPSNCSINTCPFIADALKYKNLPEELAKLESNLIILNKELNNLSKDSDIFEDIKNLFKQTAYHFKAMNPVENIIYKYQVANYGNIVEISKKSFNEVQEIFTTIKSEVTEFIELFNTLSETKSEYARIKSELEKFQNSEVIRTHFKSEIETTKEDITHINQEIVMKTAEFTTISNNLQNKKQYVLQLNDTNQAANDLIKHRESANDLQKVLDNHVKLCTEKAQLEAKLTESRKALSAAQQSKSNLTETIRQLEIDHARIKELNKQIKELNKSYANLKIVKDALDPKSGIPLIFIQAYLGKTELIANELLNLAFNGEFEIHFESSPKDFFIQVRTGENYKSDIKLASQGEIALTTISISLALIEQSIGHFNILSLDEIDASLDSTNREAFISILNSQINKLGIEQVFIISHNNAFDSVPMNLIMLKGSEEKLSNTNFMENKTVIYTCA